MLHPTHETEYRNAIDASGRPYNTVTGLITFTDGTTLEITDTILSEDPVRISRQCVDNDQLMFGGVFTNVLSLNLVTDVDRYKFFGAKIELAWEIEITIQEGTDDPTYQMESVPLGIFYVADAERPSEEVNLTAYDSMTLLDKELGDTQLSGTPWQIFEAIERVTGYELDFDESDLENFPNYNELMSASEVDGLHTYRDVVKEACQLLGCFAMDNRAGKLKLKGFSTTADITLDTSNWYSMVPADYRCDYIGISITSRAGTYTKFDEEDPDAVGLIWTIEDAPAWDYGLDDAQERKTTALYNLVRNIEYTPASIDMPSDATFECGDMLKMLPYNSAGYIYTIITSIEWNFHTGMQIESVGINPLIEGSTPSSSDTNRLVSQAVERSKIQFLNFTNLGEIVIGDTTPVLLGTYHFTPTADTTALFLATILLDADVDDVEEETETEEITVPVIPYYNDQETTVTDINGNPVTLSGTTTKSYIYKRDGTCDVSLYYTMIQNSGAEYRLPSNEEPYLAVETVHNGEHILTLSYVLTGLKAAIRYEFNIYITANGGTVTIPVRTLQATLIGQEVNELAKFNGEIRVDDENPMQLVNFGTLDVADVELGIPVITYIEDPNETPYVPMPDQIALIRALFVPKPDGPDDPLTESLPLYGMGTVSVTPLAEGTGQLIPHILFFSLYMSAENDDILVTEDDITFETEGMPSS